MMLKFFNSPKQSKLTIKFFREGFSPNILNKIKGAALQNISIQRGAFMLNLNESWRSC